MMPPRSATIGTLLCLCLAACQNAATAVVDRPSDITLENALKLTISAIYAARAESVRQRQNAPNKIPLGLNTCTITAVFNIAAGGTHATNLNGTVGTPSNLYLSASVSAGVTDTQTASRGNQVTVQFVSPACNPTGTLGTESPEKVTLLEQEIEAARDPNLPALNYVVPLHDPGALPGTKPGAGTGKH